VQGNIYNLTAAGNTLYFTTADYSGSEVLGERRHGRRHRGDLPQHEHVRAQPTDHQQTRVAAGNTFYFTVSNYGSNSELWASTGTLAGTLMVTSQANKHLLPDARRQTSSTSPPSIRRPNQLELWASNGTTVALIYTAPRPGVCRRN